MTQDATTTANPGSPAVFSRRATFPLVAAVGASGLVAACGSSTSPSASSSATTSAAPPTTAAATTAGTANATTNATAGSTTTAHASAAPTPTGTKLATLTQVPTGGGLILQDKKIVLTRDSGGTVHGFSAVCTHQGCIVGTVTSSQIICPCHGSHFNASTGAVEQGPAQTALPKVAVTVANNAVYAS